MSEPTPSAGDAALIVLCTCPDPDLAHRIARAVVEEHLAACVNIGPQIVSVYRWKGAVESAPEVLCLMKTTRATYPALEKRLRELHPYEVPEIIAVEINTGLPAYLQWVAENA